MESGGRRGGRRALRLWPGGWPVMAVPSGKMGEDFVGPSRWKGQVATAAADSRPWAVRPGMALGQWGGDAGPCRHQSSPRPQILRPVPHLVFMSRHLATQLTHRTPPDTAQRGMDGGHWDSSAPGSEELGPWAAWRGPGSVCAGSGRWCSGAAEVARSARQAGQAGESRPGAHAQPTLPRPAVLPSGRPEGQGVTRPLCPLGP